VNILGRLKVRYGKVACWRTKSGNISETRKELKIEEKLLWTAYRNSPTLFQTVPSPTPYDLPFPKIGGSQNCNRKSRENECTYRMAQKIWHHFFLYASTLPNINRFSKFFHWQNQEKICNSTVAKNPTTPQVCRYITW